MKIISINAHLNPKLHPPDPGGESTCRVREDSENNDFMPLTPSTFYIPAVSQVKTGICPLFLETENRSLFEDWLPCQGTQSCKIASRWFEYTEKTLIDNSVVLPTIPFLHQKSDSFFNMPKILYQSFHTQ